MIKQTIIENISLETGMERYDVKLAVNGFIEEVKASVANGEPVFLRGFGTFNPTIRKAKAGRNINKGTFVQIPERVVPTFKPANAFKDLVVFGSDNITPLPEYDHF